MIQCGVCATQARRSKVHPIDSIIHLTWAASIGVYPYGVLVVLPYTEHMQKEPRNEAQAQALIISGLRSTQNTVKIGVHFAKPAPKREAKAKPSFLSRILSRKV